MIDQNMMNQEIKEIDIDPKDQIQQSHIFTIYGDRIKYPTPFSIQCLPSQTVSEVIKKFREKSGMDEPHLKYIFNSKDLEESLTVAQTGLTNNSNISVKILKGMKGGGGLPTRFSDVSKNKTKELTFSNKAPSYREVTKGINIFGICKFKKCLAYQKEVVVGIKKKNLI